MKRADLDLAEFMPYLINRVGAALVERFTADALTGTQLTIGTWRLLLAMSNHDGTRQVDLAELTSIEVSTVSRLVTRLVQRGLASRARSARSNREVLVSLTPKGKALVAQPGADRGRAGAGRDARRVEGGADGGQARAAADAPQSHGARRCVTSEFRSAKSCPVNGPPLIRLGLRFSRDALPEDRWTS